MRLPARCCVCGVTSVPRPLGETPRGWARGTRGAYLCPEESVSTAAVMGEALVYPGYGAAGRFLKGGVPGGFSPDAGDEPWSRA